MKRYYFLIIIFSIISFQWGLAQKPSTFKIEGLIVDAQNKPISGLLVEIMNTKLSATTQKDGMFVLSDVPIGKYKLKISGKNVETTIKEIAVGKNGIESLKYTVYMKRVLEEVTVWGYLGSYLENVSEGGSRVPIPIKNNPQSVQVITQQVIQEQQAFTLNEAYRNAAGIIQVNTLNDYVIRGFRIGKNNFLVNGQSGSMYFENPPFLFNAESIEVIRGPSSVIYSFAAPGGMVNYVTKKPLNRKFIDVNMSGGSFETFRFHVDLNTPLNHKTTTLFRINIGYENAGSFVDFLKNRSFFISPIFSFKLSKKISIISEFSYLRDNRTINYENGIPAFDNNIFAVPFSFAIHEPTDFSNKNSIQLQSTVKYKLNKKIDLNLGINYNKVEGDAEYHITFDVPDSTGDIPRGIEVLKQDHSFYSINFHSNYQLNFREIKNKITFGVDYIDFHEDYPNYKLKDANPINFLKPVYGNLSDIPSYIYNSSFWYYKTKSLGIYLQDYFAFGKKVKGIIGIRFDDYKYNTSFDDAGTEYPDKSSIFTIIPRFGLVYEPISKISVYGNFYQGFETQRSNYFSVGGTFTAEKSTHF